VKVVRRSNTEAMQRLLDATAASQPTFTGDPRAATPAGYRAEEHRRRLGAGDEVFARAREAILTWQVQRGAGLVVHAASDRVEVGTDVVVGLPAGPVLILAPCRVDRVFDSPTKAGFRYVTMPGHPELGHEEFVAERDMDDNVDFVVRPVSRPGSVLTWLGLPIGRVIQHRASRRYLDAMADTTG